MLPYRRLNLGPTLLPQQLQAFLNGVVWLSLERMSRQSDLDPLLNLLTLPVRPLAELQEGKARGRALGEATDTLRQLNRRCGPLSEATTARIQALPLEQLESLAEALLDFSGLADLTAWLEEH